MEQVSGCVLCSSLWGGRPRRMQQHMQRPRDISMLGMFRRPRRFTNSECGRDVGLKRMGGARSCSPSCHSEDLGFCSRWAEKGWVRQQMVWPLVSNSANGSCCHSLKGVCPEPGLVLGTAHQLVVIGANSPLTGIPNLGVVKKETLFGTKQLSCHIAQL